MSFLGEDSRNGAHLHDYDDDCGVFDDYDDDCGVFDDYDDDCGVFDDVDDDDLFQEETLTVECTKKQCPPLTDCLHRWDCQHYYCKIFIFIIFAARQCESTRWTAAKFARPR